MAARVASTRYLESRRNTVEEVVTKDEKTVKSNDNSIYLVYLHMCNKIPAHLPDFLRTK